LTGIAQTRKKSHLAKVGKQSLLEEETSIAGEIRSILEANRRIPFLGD
jgi:hypothetical protein